MKATADYKAARYIPKNSIAIEEPGVGAVYVYPATGYAGKIYYGARAFRPKARKPDWAYLFKSDAELDRKIADWFESQRQHKKRVADRRAEEFAGHNFKVGDIVTNSWGYDQTNVDWYMVKRTTRNYVWLTPVACAPIEEESKGYSSMSQIESLALDADLQPIETRPGKLIKHRAAGDSVTMRHGVGSKWNGEQKYSSWYA